MPVTLASNALTTAAAVYDELGLALPGGGASDKILRLINTVSQQVENHLKRKLRRKVYSAESPEQIQGAGGPWLFLSRWPIETVTAVTVRGEAITDYGRQDALDEKGVLYRVAGWPRQVGCNPITGDPEGDRAYNVTVAYTGGYKLPNDSGDGTPLPADLEQIVLNEIVIAYRAPRHHLTEETTPGGWKRKFAANASESATRGLSKLSLANLEHYKRTHMVSV